MTQRTSGRVKKGRTDRRRALAVLTAFAATVLTTAAASCLARRDGLDHLIPRDLPGAPMVRVALVKGAPSGAVEVRGPFALYAEKASGERVEPAILMGEALPATTFSIVGGHGRPQPAIGNRGFDVERLALVPERPGTLVVEGQAYRGDLVVTADREGALLGVNRLNLEEYVAGVVGCEMPLAYPEPALRAQAIAARTYVLFQARGRRAEPYDVNADQSSQVYKGLKNETDTARRVTLATLGQVLSYRQELFCTYFHSTCGGRTIAASWVFGDRDMTPLSGASCGFCESSRYYRWEHRVKKADLAQSLARAGYPVRSLGPVEIAATGPAGHVASVRVAHEGGELLVKGSRFRQLVGYSAVRSTWFEVEDEGAEVKVVGRGFGHGVGLCQVGARGMAERGYGTVEILKHYYPAAEILALYPAPGGRASPAP